LFLDTSKIIPSSTKMKHRSSWPVVAALAALALPCAAVAEQGAPPPVGSAQQPVSIAVPAGRDWQSPPGVDLTSGFTEGFEGPVGSSGPELGTGEWVIVPIPFKNALLGAGLQVGIGRLYKPESHPEQEKTSMYGLGGMYAEGGSWAAVAADRRYWGTGALRSTVAVGMGEVHYEIDFSEIFDGVRLPVGQTFSGGQIELGYETVKNLWLSAGFKFATTELTIKGLEGGTGNYLVLPKLKYDMALAVLKAEWDSRSDQFYPRGGSLFKAEVDLADTGIGSQTNYQVYQLAYNGYKAINDRNTLAWRVAGKTVTGDPPFFALPWFGSGVDLRGYAPGTYIGKSMLAGQAEWRWQATFRLGLVAFAGVGGSYGDIAYFNQDSFLPAGGLGLRWRLTKQNRVNFRVDYAWGKDDRVLLVSAGEAF
jgi:hypothetical protein